MEMLYFSRDVKGDDGKLSEAKTSKPGRETVRIPKSMVNQKYGGMF